MDLLVVFGPPAAGKMTVGRVIAARTRYRLFHNHMTIEPLLGLFAFEEPAFHRLASAFRRQILDECLQQDRFDLIFTYVWDLDAAGDDAFVRSLQDRVTARGGTTRYVELVCRAEERQRRNRTPERLDHKRSKRDVAWSDANLQQVDARHRTTSREGEMAERVEHYVRIDNTDRGADEVAAEVIDEFGLA